MRVGYHVMIKVSDVAASFYSGTDCAIFPMATKQTRLLYVWRFVRIILINHFAVINNDLRCQTQQYQNVT